MSSKKSIMELFKIQEDEELTDEAFVVDNDTPDELEDLRGTNAEKTGTFDLSKMKIK